MVKGRPGIATFKDTFPVHVHKLFIMMNKCIHGLLDLVLHPWAMGEKKYERTMSFDNGIPDFSSRLYLIFIIPFRGIFPSSFQRNIANNVSIPQEE